MKPILSLFFLFAFGVCVQGQVQYPAQSIKSVGTLSNTCAYQLNGKVNVIFKTGSSAGFYSCKSTGDGWNGPYPTAAGASTDATYITQTPNGTLSAEQALSALASGLLKNHTGDGVLSIATPGTDYVAPGGALGTPSSGTLTNATGLPEGGLSLTDITTNNFSITKHGFVPKGTNVGSFLRDDGTWAAPTGGITNSAGVGILPYTLDGSGNLGASPLIRTDANSTEHRNGANTQNFRIYGTYTDASNYARLLLSSGAGYSEISLESAGSGAGANILYLANKNASSTANIVFQTQGAGRWDVTGLGHFIAETDNALDIGASGANRPRTGYFGTSVIAPAVSATTSLTVGGGTAILKHLSGTATLDFANLAAIGCEDLTVTVTGAALGDTVALGIPNGSVVANGTFTGWVSAADTVTIRFCTVVSGNPASGTFRADVWGH